MIFALVNPTQSKAAQNGSWTITGNMLTRRIDHTATLLNNGKVLIVGGLNTSSNQQSPSGYLKSAELYDPQTNQWTSAGNMTTSRYSHTATLLKDGRVLIVGGYNSQILSSVEIYNPSTNSWSSVENLHTGRVMHQASLLQNGRVVVTGGESEVSNEGSIATTEIFDPATGEWEFSQNMLKARYGHTSLTLSNGKVLVIGGINSLERDLDTVELYDPSSQTWSYVSKMLSPRGHFKAILLNNGKVLISSGGNNNILLNSAEIYDPETDSWKSTGNMVMKRANSATAKLLNGDIIEVGGMSEPGNGSSFQASTEIFLQNEERWELTTSMPNSRYGSSGTTLLNGSVLISGGSSNDSPEFARLESIIYTPSDQSQNTPTPTPPITGGILDVPLYKQGIAPFDNGDPGWEGEEFDHASAGQFTCGKTMAQCGCATSSIAMMLNYHGVTKLPDGSMLNPGTLNAWLKRPDVNGYDRNLGVRWATAATVAKKAKAQNPGFRYNSIEYDKDTSYNVTRLSTDLQQGIPNLLEVSSPGMHFVVATGKENNIFTINDPLFNKTSLAQYAKAPKAVRRFVPAFSDMSYITYEVDKDVDIVVRDESGEVVGQSYLEYSPVSLQDDPNTSEVLKIYNYAKPETGKYTVELSSSKSTTYQLDETLITEDGDVKSQTFKGIIDVNTNNEFKISYDKRNLVSSKTEIIVTFDKVKLDLKDLYRRGKIKNKIVYDTLRLQVELAERAAQINRQPLGNKLAVIPLKTFLLELNKVRGKSVTEDAYQILYKDVSSLIKSLQENTGASPTPTPGNGGS